MAESEELVMDFSNDHEDDEGSTREFLDVVGDLLLEHRTELPRMWDLVREHSWADALKEVPVAGPIICPHTQGHPQGKTASIGHDYRSDEARSGENFPTNRSRQPRSSLIDMLSQYSQQTSKQGNDEADGPCQLNSQNTSARNPVLAAHPSQDDNDTSTSTAGQSKSPIAEDEVRSLVNALPESPGSSHCRQCLSNNPAYFPFVSDVGPLAIAMVLEALHSHKELRLNVMAPASTSERPKYLSNGLSFRVTHVPWQQVRIDTGGRILSDAVYKRLNHNAPRHAWLDFMKDLVVTHHMTYHVSDEHKRNVVKLLGLGWEKVIDDFRQEPTLAPVIALEHAPYGTLEDLFYSSEFLSSYEQKLTLLTDVCEGLRALHASNVIHGDVSPQNILVFGDTTYKIIAKLCDFGLSIIDPDSGPDFQRLPGGTAIYLAPEASRPIAKDHLKFTDVYSFGIVAWQTLLGGAMPFFSPRFRDGQTLDGFEIQQLKTGRHRYLAALYDISTSFDEFSRLNDGTEMFMENYDPPRDSVNGLLIAMAADSLSQMSGTVNPLWESGKIPASEIATLLSLLQICLTNLKKALGLRFHGFNPRERELYSSIYERFFITLRHSPSCQDLNGLSHWDTALAQHLGSCLAEYYLWKLLAGDQSDANRQSILTYLALSASAGDVKACSTALSIHRFLKTKMKWPDLYTTGTALALLKGHTALSWNSSQSLYSEFQTKFTRALIRRFQEEQITVEQNNAATRVVLGLPMGRTNINARNNEGDTLLSLAFKSANFPMVIQLLEDHDASVAIANNYGETPIHWLHNMPAGKPIVVEAVAVLLHEAEADLEKLAHPPEGLDHQSYSNPCFFPTPLLRAVASRNIPAVSCLVQLGAEVSMKEQSVYAKLGISPLSLAASMLEDECLEVMLPYWTAEPFERGPDDNEVYDLWENAIGGLSVMERVRIHGDQYSARISRTLEVLSLYLGPCYLVSGRRSSLEYAAEAGDLVWMEAILEKYYSDPTKAVLADLQRGLACAVARGHFYIASRLREHGALALLPHKWAWSSYSRGRPGRWDEKLVDRLNSQTFESGHTWNTTKCSLHFCDQAGSDAVQIADNILERPVINESLVPSLPDLNDHGLTHYVTGTIKGWYVGLNRPDEENYTPLSGAIANAEFSLARHYLERGAKIQVGPVSLLSQIFEDSRTCLPNQLEFLLEHLHSARKEAMREQQKGESTKVDMETESNHFIMKLRVFGRLQPSSSLYSSLNSNLSSPECQLCNWTLEKHTLITATAEACKGLDNFNKRRCWRPILSIFNDPVTLLQKAENGEDALQICIRNGDYISLWLLVNCLKRDIFDEYSVVDTIRDLILDDLPAYVAHSPKKRLIIAYRCDLGEMIKTMVGAGDTGRKSRSDVCDKIVRVLDDEFPILAQGFSQRMHNPESIERFTQDSESFCNALLAALYSCPSQHHHPAVISGLEQSFQKTLHQYFDSRIHWGMSRGFLEARVVLTPVIARNTQHVGRKDKLPQSHLIDYKEAGGSQNCRPRPTPLIDWNVFRKLIVLVARVENPDGLPLPSFLDPPSLEVMTNLGFLQGTTIQVPGLEFFISTVLRQIYPDRLVKPVIRTKSDPPYYKSVGPLHHGNEGQYEVYFDREECKEAYFRCVITQINSSARSVLDEERTDQVTEALLNYVDNVVDTGALTTIDSNLIHPHFGRVRGRDRYQDLSLDIFIEASRRSARRVGELYDTLGRDLPDEVRRILDLSESSTEEE
ncbi:serine threonine kinase [Fusarium mundagurra]|uniref:EKC/KEOPS complex subunit BUD32 n=1 Tax=Fusarium mundagurra TaxID=1567541 RepID=A0A8H5Y229_9HYPO|nr:serine threonine kinase [Fusarium mundagurra]